MIKSTVARQRNVTRQPRRRATRAPKWLQATAGAVIATAVLLGINWAYWVLRKPSELLFPVSGGMNKLPVETWHDYGALFRRYSTAVMTPAFLAALAQAEGAGNPVARTYWRWRWNTQPLELYRPASSSVGLYQMTNGTFDEARHFCIRDHQALRDTASGKPRCGLSRPYVRILPRDAIELTSAYLDRHVTTILAHYRLEVPSSSEQRHLAAVIHLCGAAAGDAYVRRGFRLSDSQRCGAHDTGSYLARLDSLTGEFAKLAVD